MMNQKYSAATMAFTSALPCPAQLTEIVDLAEIRETPAKVKKVMGELVFPKAPAQRPYIFGCMVLSADGKMAFPDNQEGHLVSKENRLDPIGSLTDFWVMNVCRTYADAVILGCNTLRTRLNKQWFAEISDSDLIEARQSVLGKKTSHPWSIIASIDGKDVPLEHSILDMEPSVGILTSPFGAEYLAGRLGRKSKIVKPGERLDQDQDCIRLIAAGAGETVDTLEALQILRQGGIKNLSVEAPGYIWHLIGQGLLDEFFLNYSGVYVGGEFTLGKATAFTTTTHPHATLLSLGYHNGFIYTRQKLSYE
ncbi:MAG: dihydrofolate reductase family protein [Veillonellaceae bacterium]|nr:dihydrofolate reductase family protein [Veillonellaceae bacterium]